MKAAFLVLIILLLDKNTFAEKMDKEKTGDPDAGQLSSLRQLNMSRLQDLRSFDARNWKRQLRRQSLLRWCDSKRRADEIDHGLEWKKIISLTILVVALVHLVFFCHPSCNRMH